MERYLKDEFGDEAEKYSAEEYYKYLDRIIPTINSLLGKNFPRIKLKEFTFKKNDSPPHFALLCYARHLGFPSPLLDWSVSYYIAAFFAFKQAKDDCNVSIFSYQDWNGKSRRHSQDEPFIIEQGSYVETHSRHYKQQSIYTLCTAQEDEDSSRDFRKHESAIEINPDNHNLKKYFLDSNEKEEVLEKLYRMNINDYTIFGDEESLMRMLAYKEFRRL